MPAMLPPAPERTPDFDQSFASRALDRTAWIDHYLPHWTTPDRSLARYDIDDDGLRLRIDADQPNWREDEAPLRVSHLQTGNAAGPAGSRRGTHRYREDLTVVTPTPTRLLWTPSEGRIDVTVSATTATSCMLAAWLVGSEEGGERDSGEICLFEIDGSAIGDHASRARSGIKSHRDDRLTTDMADVDVPVDATRPHTWTAIWGQNRTVVGCEGVVVRTLEQAPAYPLVLMLDLWDFGTRPPEPHAWQKTAHIHRVRGWTA